MNGAVVIIVSAFFIIGIAVGIIAVAAISALRGGRRGDSGDPSEYGPHRPGAEPLPAGWDDAGPDDHPGRPGNAENDFIAS